MKSTLEKKYDTATVVALESIFVAAPNMIFLVIWAVAKLLSGPITVAIVSAVSYLIAVAIVWIGFGHVKDTTKKESNRFFTMIVLPSVASFGVSVFGAWILSNVSVSIIGEQLFCSRVAVISLAIVAICFIVFCIACNLRRCYGRRMGVR